MFTILYHAKRVDSSSSAMSSFSPLSSFHHLTERGSDPSSGHKIHFTLHVSAYVAAPHCSINSRQVRQVLANLPKRLYEMNTQKDRGSIHVSVSLSLHSYSVLHYERLTPTVEVSSWKISTRDWIALWWVQLEDWYPWNLILQLMLDSRLAHISQASLLIASPTSSSTALNLFHEKDDSV